MKNSENQLFFDILEKIPYEELKFTEYSMMLAAKISNELRKNKSNQKKLAKALGKKESEISKWLSGDHNFTIRTLAKIESVIKTPLLNVELDDYTFIESAATSTSIQIVNLKNLFKFPQSSFCYEQSTNFDTINSSEVKLAG